MEKSPLMEPLLEKTEEYGKVIFELVKLKSLSKATDVASAAASRSLLIFILILFSFTLSIGISLWVGELLGKDYYGFLVVSLFYALVGIIVYFIHPKIKTRFQNSFISHMLN